MPYLKHETNLVGKQKTILKPHQSGDRIFSEGFGYFRNMHCMNSLLLVLISIYGPLDAGSCPSDTGGGVIWGQNVFYETVREIP